MEPLVSQHRGWDVVRLTSPELQVDVVPGKGGDITSIRHRTGVELLWQAPWGLRHKGSAGTAGDSSENLIEWYPGGWQTVFPNAGDAVTEHGAEWGMHGEAWLAPYDWETNGAGEIVLRTRLVRSPFEVTRRIRVVGPRLTVTETTRNAGGELVETAWGHHAAFGAPFLGGSCRLETNAATFLADDERDTPAGDLAVGARSSWPYAETRDGTPVDLRDVPGMETSVDRLGYLLDFDGQPFVSLTNVRLGLTARLSWDAATMPAAWLWYEMHASPGFPWYKGVYVLGIEPHSSHPGQGLHAIRAKTGTQLFYEPGQSRIATTTLDVTPVA